MCFGIAKAQYNLSSCGTGTMSINTGTLPVYGDDAVSSSIPISFPFSFYGTNYSNLYISTNGFITFTPSGSGCCLGYLLPNTNNTPYIALAHTDLVAYSSTPGQDGSIYYSIIGSAPNRIFVVHFQNLQSYSSSSQYIINGEIQLFEGSNEIRLVNDTINLPVYISWIHVRSATGLKDLVKIS